MIKIFSLKQQKEDEQSKGGSGKKTSAAQLRLQKDISDLHLPPTCKLDWVDPDDLLHFTLVIKPEEGYYHGGKFTFNFDVSSNYPHEPPKVKCAQTIYHPNIDTEGNVCLNILRDDWKPVLTINSICFGLQFLFSEPNPDDPLNKEAAQVLSSNKKQFEQNVTRTMKGCTFNGRVYDKVM